ncbi:MAG: endonuclease/exonuclease/phosphatase family protein [Planctomycetota bacterium]
MQLRVVTYNIHKGIGGVNRRYRLGRIVEVLAHLEPDVALLQEVDDGVPRSRGERQAEVLARELGFEHYAFQPNVKLRRGHYGNAILSRLPIGECANLELTVRPKKRRRAQIARLVLREHGHRRTLVVANTHLGLAGFERSIQLRRLLGCHEIAGLRHDTPCVIGGDFNDAWEAIGRRHMAPAGLAAATKKARTFPAVAPLRALDGIYVRGDVEVDHAYAARSRLTREASDHLPLCAVVRVGGGGV